MEYWNCSLTYVVSADPERLPADRLSLVPYLAAPMLIIASGALFFRRRQG